MNEREALRSHRVLGVFSDIGQLLLLMQREDRRLLVERWLAEEAGSAERENFLAFMLMRLR
jgi:hypothetical protein